DKYECSICNNSFDGNNYRPRALPCGHGFCTQCIETYIQTGRKTCPTCRVEHGANSAKDLPVSFLLEEFVQKAANSSSQAHTKKAVYVDENVEMCPKHKGVPLYFHCKTHNIKVCHSCAIIDHPAISCNLISFEDEIKEKKETQIVTLQKQRKCILDAEKDLKLLYQNNIDYLTEQKMKKRKLEREIELMITKIEQINKVILEKEKSQYKVNYTLANCPMKVKTLEVAENRLNAETRNKHILKECERATAEILLSQKWEENWRKELKVWK
ncbi:unnamed protein product, partial [Meganyctiphanes norvegica]